MPESSVSAPFNSASSVGRGVQSPSGRRPKVPLNPPLRHPRYRARTLSIYLQAGNRKNPL